MSNNWQSNSWPVSQTILSWTVLILFVVLAGDWSFVQKGLEHSREHRQSVILPGTPEHGKISAEMDFLVWEIRQAADNGTLTIDQAAEAQMKAIAKTARFEVPCCAYQEKIYGIAHESFVANWVPPKEMPADFLDDLNKNPDRKLQHVEFSFGWDWREAQAKARLLFPETRPVSISGQQWLIFGRWLVKWYWLLTIPSLLIFLINRKYKGESVVAELLLQPKRLVLACLFGPFGLLVISETAAKAYRYRQLEDEFYVEHGRRPDAEQVQAIWQRVENPLLQFEQALELGRTSSERVRRPLTVCAIAWVLGVWHQPMMRQSCPSAVVQEVSSVEIVKTVNDSKFPSGGKLLLAILPADVSWQIETEEEEVLIVKEEAPRDVLWEAILARGPPPAVKAQPLLTTSFALNCITQKG